MSEYYVMSDTDTYGGTQDPHEITSPTLAGFAEYVDDFVRRDLVSVRLCGFADDAVEALRRENFPAAINALRPLGIYLRLEAGDEL